MLLLLHRLPLDLLEVVDQVPEVLPEVLQQMVLHRLLSLQLVKQARGAAVVVPVLNNKNILTCFYIFFPLGQHLFVDHHVAGGVQGLLHLSHGTLDLKLKSWVISYRYQSIIIGQHLNLYTYAKTSASKTHKT